MSTLYWRGLLLGATMMVAVFWSRPAAAQVGNSGLNGHPGGLYQALVTGTYYDIANQAKAEQRLGYLESKLKRDSERGNRAAMDRDIRQIERDKYRIAVDVWLIRQNSQRDPGYYPVRTDEISCAALAQVATPPQFPVYSQLYPLPTSTPAPALTPPPAAAVLMIPITIVNAEPLGDGIAFAIDNVSYLAASNSRQDLSVAANSSITYDAGGSLGQQKYQIVPGIYEFHSTPKGWALYKLPATP